MPETEDATAIEAENEELRRQIAERDNEKLKTQLAGDKDGLTDEDVRRAEHPEEFSD